MKKVLGRTALLEIGAEELPARFVEPAVEQLRSLIHSGLAERGVSFESVHAFGSPRRLTVLINGLAAKAEDRREDVIGPPLKAAKDAAGDWTKAATGFAKAQGVAVSKLVLKETAKGERYVAERFMKGGPVDAVLRSLFPAVIERLTFPKSMVWNETGFRFARPIRWFISLYGTKLVRFQLAGVTAGRTSVGLLSLGAPRIPVSRPEKYVSLLRSRCIFVDPQERRDKIEAQLDAIGKKLKAKPIVTADHLLEVVHLTEYPTCILGHFPEAYLALPREVLVSVLRKHQKFFPLESPRRTLINAFVGVRNGPSESEAVVRDGYERVLIARLSDAKFFFTQDMGTPIASFAERLGEIAFLEKAGSMADKRDRIGQLAVRFGKRLSLPSDVVDAAARAAFLAKADLLTQMVTEFPELQGVAGRFYAAAQGESEAVARAVEEHYWPLSADGALPESKPGALAALADKLDSLAAHVHAGNSPSGSADPYGMRRLSSGVIRILLENDWRISLDDLAEEACAFQTYGGGAERVKGDLKAFLLQRLESFFENQGYRRDEISAVLGPGTDTLANVSERLAALKSVRNRPEFDALVAGIKRARNVLRQAEARGVLPAGNGLSSVDAAEGAERDLLDAIGRTAPAIKIAIADRRFKDAVMLLAPLKAPIDAFFDAVMVMADDAAERERRLRILQAAERLFSAIADFSCLQAADSSKSKRAGV